MKERIVKEAVVEERIMKEAVVEERIMKEGVVKEEVVKERIMRPVRVYLIIGLLTGLAGFSCDRSYTPKPSGYLRIDFPEKHYERYTGQPEYQFEIPTYARVVPDRTRGAEPGWVDVVIPQFKATIYLSYKHVQNNLDDYIEDSRTLVYKHTVKADGIEETPFMERDKGRFGMVYDLKGNVATAVQFFVTDSTDNFLRGSLYFNAAPNRDSLNPIIDFLREDIIHMIETTQWNY